MPFFGDDMVPEYPIATGDHDTDARALVECGGLREGYWETTELHPADNQETPLIIEREEGQYVVRFLFPITGTNTYEPGDTLWEGSSIREGLAVAFETVGGQAYKDLLP